VLYQAKVTLQLFIFLAFREKAIGSEGIQTMPCAILSGLFSASNGYFEKISGAFIVMMPPIAATLRMITSGDAFR
jgi:hypothetical protein